MQRELSYPDNSLQKISRQNNRVQNNRVQNNRVQNNRVQNNRVQNNRVQNNRVQNNRLKKNKFRKPEPSDNFAYVDYKEYKLSVKEILRGLLILCIIIPIAAIIFFDSIWFGLIFVIPVPIYKRQYENFLCNRRREKLEKEFAEFLSVLSANLRVGYSFENSVREAYRELIMTLPEDNVICSELREMIRKNEFNIPIETAMYNLAERTDIREIKLFCDVVKTAKRTGGDIIEIINNSANIIEKNISTEREIRMIINGKKSEHLIMTFMPVFVIMYMRITSGEMIKVLYTTYIGRVVMFMVIVGNAAAYMWGRKITDIR